MKANAPEKLYVDSREHWMKSWTAFTTKAKGDDIEYTRTDAFIKKAVEWLENLFEPDGSIVPENIKLIEDFKNYMEGE